MHAHLRFEAGEPPVVAQLEFLIGGRPLTGTPEWAAAQEDVAAAVAVCLQGFVRDPEQLLIDLTAATPPGRRPQEHLYQGLGLERPGAVYAFLAYGDEDNRAAELIVDVPPEELDGVVRAGWDWNSFRAYVLEAPTAEFLRELIETRDPQRRRQLELERCVCVLEDSDDATALRILSAKLSRQNVEDRIDLEAIQGAYSG
jgi:hypothetical protein